MNVAGARRLAGRLHRGQIDSAGQLYLDHVARVAAEVEAKGGNATQLMAAWLHGVSTVGMRPRDLVPLGVPWRVVRMVEAVGKRPPWSEEFDVRLADAKECRGADLVFLADWSDIERTRGHYRRPPVVAVDLESCTRWVESYQGTGWVSAEMSDALSRHAGDPRWVAFLVPLSRHEAPYLRRIALDALAAAPGVEHQPIMLRALDDESPNCVSSAIQGLDEATVRAATPKLLEILGRDSREWAWPQREVVLRLSGSDLPEVVRAMVGLFDSGYVWAEDVARHHLAKTDRSVVPALLRQVRENAPGRSASIFALGRLRVEEAVPDLVRVLGEVGDDEYSSVLCVEALGKIASPSAVPALIEAVRDPRSGVRWQALHALRHVGDPRGGPAALVAAEDFVPWVRDAAVCLLAECGGSEAFERLVSLLGGPYDLIVLRGLLRIADERAVPALVRVVRTACDRRVRDLAARVLARCAGRNVTTGDWVVDVWLAGELGGPHAITSLVHGLADPSEVVRTRAVTALGKLGATAEIEPALRDPSPRVRTAAARVLASVGVGCVAERADRGRDRA